MPRHEPEHRFVIPASALPALAGPDTPCLPSLLLITWMIHFTSLILFPHLENNNSTYHSKAVGGLREYLALFLEGPG